MADKELETIDRNAVMEVVYDRLFGEEWQNRRSYWNAELRPLMSSVNKQLMYFRSIAEDSPKRVKNRDVILLAYYRWANGTTQAQMNDEFPVSLTTIKTWVGWFRNVPEVEVELDKVGFHYHLMESYGIPWDKYEEVMRLVEEYSVQENIELTPRMAKWAWRLQQIKNPTFDRNKAKEFMNRFVEAEQEELIRIDSKGGLNEVSSDLQYELSKWQTTPIGRTHNES